MDHRDIIVIAASRGGLEAMCKLASTLPPDLDATICLVLHVHKDSPGTLDTIIGRFTEIPVSYGAEGETLQRRHLYIAPADRHMTIEPPGIIRLSETPKVNHVRPAADPLFRSVAKLYGRRAIGVVLTGGDHDGSDGLRLISGAGGIGVIQDPETAEAPSMPLSALNRDHPHYCLPLSQMGAVLAQLIDIPLSP